jgi:hypothetical protein
MQRILNLTTRTMSALSLATIVTSLVSVNAFADPSVYVLRAGGGRQGIIRVDPDTKVTSPFASFVYHGGLLGPFGSLSLTATADRIIAQGLLYYEFDADSGQLLRRYPALGPEHVGWIFRGAAVDHDSAKRLGIAPGYYGTPICASGLEGGPLCFPRVPESFPGHEAGDKFVRRHVLLRRGFDPGDTAITLAKVFPRFPVHPLAEERFVALDQERNRFVFSLYGFANDDSYRYLETRTSADVRSGIIGDETVLSDRSMQGYPARDPNLRFTKSFAFDARKDDTFAVYHYHDQNQDRQLVRQSLLGDTVETEIVRLSRDYYLDSVTTLAATEPATYTQLLPAIGESGGLNGTFWRSDMWLFNPSDQPIGVTIKRLMNAGATRQISVPAKASVKMANVLRELGGGPAGDGIALDSLVIESDYRRGAQLSIYSRTYTTSPNGGTYGQAIPAVPSLVGYSNHRAVETVSIDMAETESFFVLDKRDPDQFRHNIGAVNTGDVPLTLRLRYAEVTRNSIRPEHERFLTIAPHSVRQFNIEGLFGSDVFTTRPPRIWVSGDRPAALWLSMVDNKTGDASFVPFTQYGIEADAEAMHAFPAVAQTPGLNGTFWRTEAYGVFANLVAGGSPQQPIAKFYAVDACPSTTFRLSPSSGAPPHVSSTQFWHTTFADLAQQACSNSTVRGALEIATASWMSAFSRTYTTREDGGTYGDILPLYPQRGWPYRHFSGIELNTNVRVNVGLYNGTDSPSTIELRLYSQSGELAATRHLELAPRGSFQAGVRQLLGDAIPDGLYGLSVVSTTGQGVWPYVANVDNITGDPTNWW